MLSSETFEDDQAQRPVVAWISYGASGRLRGTVLDRPTLGREVLCGVAKRGNTEIGQASDSEA